MKNVTRFLITKLCGEHHGDNSLAQRQLAAGQPSKAAKVQAAAEIAAFKRNLGKLSTRQLKDLHARLTARLGKVALAKIMQGAKK